MPQYVDEKQCTLAEVVEYQGGKHEDEPGQPDRLLAKVSHVDVQRLRAGHREHDSSEHENAGDTMHGKKADGMHRVERGENRRCANDPDDADNPDRHEPRHHDWSEEAAHAMCAELLEEEQQQQNRNGNRHDVRSKKGVSTCSPSTAASTLIAGVIMPSPYSIDAPKTPSRTSTGAAPVTRARGGIREVSARMPPSPWLSARMTSAMYLTEMTSTSA